MEDSKKRLAQLFVKKEWTEEDKKWLLHYLENSDLQELSSLLWEEFHKTKERSEILGHRISKKILNNIHKKIVFSKSRKITSVFLSWLNKNCRFDI